MTATALMLDRIAPVKANIDERTTYLVNRPVRKVKAINLSISVVVFTKSLSRFVSKKYTIETAMMTSMTAPMANSAIIQSCISAILSAYKAALISRTPAYVTTMALPKARRSANNPTTLYGFGIIE